jgi:hypothetical protein
MATGKKTGGRGFKKGQSGNPGGRPALPDEIKAITRETKPQIIEAYYKLATMPFSDFKSYKPITAIEAGIQKCLKKFSTSGKTDQIRHIWAECHGKPKETIDAKVNIGLEQAKQKLQEIFNAD